MLLALGASTLIAEARSHSDVRLTAPAAPATTGALRLAFLAP